MADGVLVPRPGIEHQVLTIGPPGNSQEDHLELRVAPPPPAPLLPSCFRDHVSVAALSWK